MPGALVFLWMFSVNGHGDHVLNGTVDRFY